MPAGPWARNCRIGENQPFHPAGLRAAPPMASRSRLATRRSRGMPGCRRAWYWTT